MSQLERAIKYADNVTEGSKRCSAQIDSFEGVLSMSQNTATSDKSIDEKTWKMLRAILDAMQALDRAVQAWEELP